MRYQILISLMLSWLFLDKLSAQTFFDDDFEELSVESGSCTFPIFVTNEGASGSGINHNCGHYQSDDKWFSVLIPNSGAIISETSSPILPPINDNCTNAISLTVNTTENCLANTSGTLQGAVTSEPPSATCAGFEEVDVWYYFQATGQTHFVEWSGESGIYYSVWDGSCGNFENLFIVCDETSESILPNLIPGNTYYIRIAKSSFELNNLFDLCVTTPGTPVNNFCSEATLLPVYENECQSYTLATNTAASGSNIIPSCGNYNGGDVWFNAVVPASGHLSIFQNSIEIAVQLEAFDACTGNSLGCSDSGNLQLSGLSAGQTIYIMAWESGNNNFGNFEVCAFDPNPITCEVHLELPSTDPFELNTPQIFQAQYTLTSYQTIGNVIGGSIQYLAGEEIILGNGFSTASGTDSAGVLDAYIQGCNP